MADSQEVKIGRLETEMQNISTKVDDLKKDNQQNFRDLSSKIDSLHVTFVTKEELSALKLELRSFKSQRLMWIIVTALVAGIMTFAASNVYHTQNQADANSALIQQIKTATSK